MRLPDFEYLEPLNLHEALEMLDAYSGHAALLAGGTDLIVRMKRRLAAPTHLISLKNIQDLKYIIRRKNNVHIGPMTPLNAVLESDLIKNDFSALARAAVLVGAPGIQHYRGTIGGNLCLETRCIHYDQSASWRSGRTRCHKDNGETCYAEENSDRCRSANQSDGACALMALGAGILVESIRGKRIIPVEEFFTGKGEDPFALEQDELVTEIRLDISKNRKGSSFKKLTYRSAIDFALVSAAAYVEAKDGRIADARIAVGSAGAAPLLLREASEVLKGEEVGDSAAVDKTVKKVVKHASAFMVDNLGSTLEYRRKMSGVMAKRALEEALESAGS